MINWDKLLCATFFMKFVNWIQKLIKLRIPKSKDERWNDDGVLVRRITKYR